MHRREFTKRASLLVGAAWLAAPPGADAQAPPGGATVRVRPDVSLLDPNGPEILTLKKAVRVLKQRSVANMGDRIGWIGQANIHRDACPHGNWFFVPWHRAYLHFFERICRLVSGDPGFMLPYWDWTNHRTLPAVFWGDASNPLAHPADNPNFPGPHLARAIAPSTPIGEEFVGADVINNDILGVADFYAAVGGDPAPQPRPDDGDNRAGGTLEGTPHNNVHGAIGGDMGFINSSPRDPIFWLHHANVDRTWALWADTYPTVFPADSTYLDFPMNDFFDEMGMPSGLTVRQTLSTFALGYRYPDQKPPQVVSALAVRAAAKAPEVSKELRVAVPNAAAANSKRPLQVVLNPPPALRTRLATIGKPRVEIQEFAPSVPETVRLKISGVEKHLPTDAFVRVFLNCDYLGPATTPSDPHYVGSFAFFNHGGPGDAAHALPMVKGGSGFYLNATDAVKALAVDPLFDFSKLRVGIIPHLRPGAQAPENNQMLALTPGQVEVSVIPPGAEPENE